MKALYVFLFLPVIIMSGCESKTETPEIASDFSADFTAEYRQSEFRGEVSNNRQGVTNINITYPETIDGIKIRYRSSEMQITRENLTCSADEALIPDRSFPSVLRSVFRGISEGRAKLASENENVCTYTLSVSMGNCKITAEDGKLTEAQIEEIDFDIKFSKIKTAQE